jgi:hypothetical protein
MSHLACCSERVRSVRLAPVDLEGTSALGPGRLVSRDGRGHEDRGAADRHRERENDRLDRRSRVLAGDGFVAACDHRDLCLAANHSCSARNRSPAISAVQWPPNLRTSDPLFSHTLFGVYLGIALSGGLWLRMVGVRDLLPVS